MPTFRLWYWANGIRSVRRAMVPSSFIISQITLDGFSPAKREISTAASVWPARTSTPPSLASSGKTWPGVERSDLPLVGSMATAMVCARSPAEMPVVTPSAASIETVKAVDWRWRLSRGINGKSSSATRPLVSDRQIRPRPYFAMKLIASGVAIWAGMTKSPSFSRSSSSTRMNMRPLRASSIISSIEERKVKSSLVRGFSGRSAIAAARA